MKDKIISNQREIKSKVKDYFARSLVGIELGDEDDIFELGLVHSLFAMQLILFIEKEFGIELEDDEIDLERIKTLNQITSLILRKLELQC